MTSHKPQTDTQKRGLIPRLRFPEFRDAGPWEVKRLGEIGIFLKGKGISKSDITPNGTQPCIRYGELYTYYKETIDSVISFTNLDSDDLVLSQPNDVIIPASGETQEDIATASCVKKGGIALGGDLNIIRSPLNGLFLSYYLNSAKKKDITAISQGISVVHLYANQLKTLKIHIPSNEEQQKIADFLASLDERITAEAEKLDALKLHKKGLMQQLFPRDGETVPRLRFPEFRNAGPWEEKPLSQLVAVIDGDRGKNYPKSDEFFSSGYCIFLNAKNVTKNGFIFNDVQFISKEKDEALRKGKLKRFDIVLTTRGSVGNFAYFSEDVEYENLRINSGMVILRVSSKLINSKYFYIYCKSEFITRTIDDVAFGNAQLQLTVSGIQKFRLYFPSIPEQQKIADCFTSLDELITAQAQKISILKLHRKGLMQQLFPSGGKI